MNDIRPLRTEADYDWALVEIEHYFDHLPQPGTAEADRFDVMTDLVNAYDAIGLIEVEPRIPRHTEPEKSRGLLSRLKKPFKR